MDEHTYSNTKAAVNLYHILDTPEYIRYRPKARRILSKWFQYSSAMLTLANPDITRGSLNLWRAQFLYIADNSHFPELIRTHLRSIIIAQYRKCWRKVPKERMTHVVIETSLGSFPLDIAMHQENDVWVGVCKQLGTSQFDAKWSICKQKLAEAIKLHLETLNDVGEIERVLKIKTWVDPVVKYAKKHGISLTEAATHLIENNKGLMESLDKAVKRTYDDY